MGCRCWKCRKAGGLATLAPFMAAAYRAELRLRPLRRKKQAEIHRLEKLLAHRDLQLIRSGNLRGGRAKSAYLAERQAKLRSTEKRLERARASLEGLR